MTFLFVVYCDLFTYNKVVNFDIVESSLYAYANNLLKVGIQVSFSMLNSLNKQGT